MTSLALNIAALSSDKLRAELQQLANNHRDAASMLTAVSERLPGVTVSIIYCGPMYMGLAMSHHHPGVVSF